MAVRKEKARKEKGESWKVESRKMEAFIHPLPPLGYSPLSQGESWLQTENQPYKRKTPAQSVLAVGTLRAASAKHQKPLPPSGYSPLSQGES